MDHVFLSLSDARFALVQSNNESTTEQKILDLDSGERTASLRKPESGVEYYADVAQDRVFINSNLNGQFGLFETAMPEKHADTVESNWKSFLRSKNGVEQFYLYGAGLVALTKQDNQTTISVYSYDGTAKKTLPLESDGRVAWLSTLGDYRSNKIRIRSMSMTTPPLWEEFDVKALTKTNLSQDIYHASLAKIMFLNALWSKTMVWKCRFLLLIAKISSATTLLLCCTAMVPTGLP